MRHLTQIASPSLRVSVLSPASVSARCSPRSGSPFASVFALLCASKASKSSTCCCRSCRLCVQVKLRIVQVKRGLCSRLYVHISLFICLCLSEKCGGLREEVVLALSSVFACFPIALCFVFFPGMSGGETAALSRRILFYFGRRDAEAVAAVAALLCRGCAVYM